MSVVVQEAGVPEFRGKVAIRKTVAGHYTEGTAQTAD